MKIMIFDDRDQVRRDTRDHIMSYRPDIKATDITLCEDCSSVIFQISKIRKFNEPTFDLYIMDLNTNTIGLTAEETKMTGTGLWTGWFLFIKHIYKVYSTDLEILDKIVFFSDYVNDLDIHFNTEEPCENEKKIYKILKNEKKAIIKKSSRYEILNHFIS